jgi:hypothetical protein
MVLRRVVISVVLGASLAFATTPSFGAPAQAREAYEVGKRAYDAGDYTSAAKSFAQADALAPNARVLELAMAAANKADAPVLGMELAERARARNLPALAASARELFASRVGELRVTCPPEVVCSAKLDDESITVGQPRTTTVGDHTVVLEVDGVVEQRSVLVETGKTLEVEAAPVRLGPPAIMIPTPPPDDAPPPKKRPSSTWFWVSASATTLVGTGTLLSGLDTLGLHDDLAADRTNAGLADRGRAAEVRTNVLMASTAAFAVATAVVGYFVFRAPREVPNGYAAKR